MQRNTIELGKAVQNRLQKALYTREMNDENLKKKRKNKESINAGPAVKHNKIFVKELL